jgi:glycosyltransferase involved in cell wall biosynthesis
MICVKIRWGGGLRTASPYLQREYVNNDTATLRLLMAGIHWPPETFLRRLIHNLAGANVDVTVGCSERPELNHPRLHWLPMPTWEGAAPARLGRLVGMALRALTQGSGDIVALRRDLPTRFPRGQRLQAWNRVLPFAGRHWDVIYFPWNAAAIDHLPVFALSAPVVVSCRGAQVNVAPHNPDRATIRDGLRTTFARAAAVHCVSEIIKTEAMQLGLDAAKAYVIRPAVDPAHFHPPDRSLRRTGVFSIVTTGSLIWRKGQDYALQAVRFLVDRGIPARLDIIGHGPDRRRILYNVHDLGLQKNVRLLGSLREEEVRQHLQDADAFCLPSLSEGISNAVLEAMACGLPVVTTDCGGMSEAVTEGVEGFLVPVRDPEAMARALAQLATDRGLSQRMGQAARQRVVREFTLAQQTEAWLKLLGDLPRRRISCRPDHPSRNVTESVAA